MISETFSKISLSTSIYARSDTFYMHPMKNEGCERSISMPGADSLSPIRECFRVKVPVQTEVPRVIYDFVGARAIRRH